MAKESATDRVSRWQARVIAAEKIYKRWSDTFDCRTLEQYYTGKQWKGLPESEAAKRYVINLFFPTIETAIPTLMFYRPQVKVEPRAPHAASANSDAPARASLIESTLQTFIDDPSVHFKQQTLLALKDAWFRFGVVEVGYSSDWIDNPHAAKPILNEDGQALKDKSGNEIPQPAKVVKPGSEQLYVKRIPAKDFRVSVSGKNQLDENDWCGYCEWVYAEDVKKNPKYKNTANLQTTGQLVDMPEKSDDPDYQTHTGMLKLWKVWDLRQGVRYVFAEGQKTFLLDGEPAPYHPFGILKFYELLDAFYPLPPTANWLGPQDELNETREMQKTHRRRFTRRYTYLTGSIDETELEKLESGQDGTYAKSNQVNPIVPVPDAPLDRSNTVEENMQTRQDFATIAGVTGESQQSPSADTATEANIMNAKQQIRENQGRVTVADWLADISRLMLICLRDKMQLPFWVKVNSDPLAGDTTQQGAIAQQWKEIKSEDLEGLDVDVKIDIASLSPVSTQAQMLAWNQVLQLLTNPAMLMLLMQPDPTNMNEPSMMLRRTLGYYDIKSEADVREIWRVGQQALAQLMASQIGAMAAKSGGSAPAGIPSQPAAGVPQAGAGMIQ